MLNSKAKVLREGKELFSEEYINAVRGLTEYTDRWVALMYTYGLHESPENSLTWAVVIFHKAIDPHPTGAVEWVQHTYTQGEANLHYDEAIKHAEEQDMEVSMDNHYMIMGQLEEVFQKAKELNVNIPNAYENAYSDFTQEDA